MKKGIVLILILCSSCAVVHNKLEIVEYEIQKDNFQLIEEDYKNDAIERAALNAINLYFDEEVNKEDPSIEIKVGLSQYQLKNHSSKIDRAEVYVYQAQTNVIQFGLCINPKTLAIETAQRTFNLPIIIEPVMKQEEKEMIDKPKAWMRRVRPDGQDLTSFTCYRAGEYEITVFELEKESVVLVFSSEDQQLYSYSSGYFAKDFIQFMQQGGKQN